MEGTTGGGKSIPSFKDVLFIFREGRGFFVSSDQTPRRMRKISMEKS